MLITGILGCRGKNQISAIISDFLGDEGKRVSIVDSSSLSQYSSADLMDYTNALVVNETDVLIFKINPLDTEIFTHSGIHFDIIIFTDRAWDCNGSSGYKKNDAIKSMLKLSDDKGIVIINSDDESLVKSMRNIKSKAVTYGFNKNACITTSSIGDDAFNTGFLCCVKEDITSLKGKIVAPREVSFKISRDKFKTHNLLAAFSFAIVNELQ